MDIRKFENIFWVLIVNTTLAETFILHFNNKKKIAHTKYMSSAALIFHSPKICIFEPIIIVIIITVELQNE